MCFVDSAGFFVCECTVVGVSRNLEILLRTTHVDHMRGGVLHSEPLYNTQGAGPATARQTLSCREGSKAAIYETSQR